MHNEQQDGLYFLRAEMENWKNIDSRIIEIGGKSLIFLGPNAGGKSSTMQVFTAALDTKSIPSKPIKQGEDRATIQTVIGGTINGEPMEYTLDMYFTPANQRGRLVVTDKDGETVKQPATFVKNLIGNISFDIFKFLNDDKAKKIKTLKELTGKKTEIEVAEQKIADEKEKKSKLGNVIENDEASLKNHGFTQEDIEKYSTPYEPAIETLQKSLETISDDIDKFNKTKNVLTKLSESSFNMSWRLMEIEAETAKSTKEIERLQKLIAAEHEAQYALDQEAVNVVADIELLLPRIEKGKVWLTTVIEPSAKAISEEITTATEHNTNAEKVSEFAKKQQSLLTKKQEFKDLDKTIIKLEAAKDKIITNSQLKVPGLSFNDSEIFVDGLPMEEGQINTAKLIDISTDIAMALNPNLRVIFVPDGSMFDKASMKRLIEKIEARGFQAIIEMVKFEEGPLEIKFTESEFLN